MRLRVLLRTLLFAAKPALADKPVAPDTIPGTHIINAEQLIEQINTTPELVIIDARRRRY